MSERSGAPWSLSPARKRAIFLVALALRLSAIAVVRARGLGFGDARAYIETAGFLVRTGRYPVRSDPSGFRAPGYPAFLAASTLGHPGAVAWDQIVNALLGAAAAVMIAAIALRIFADHRVATAAGLVAAGHPAFLWLAAGVQSEPLFMVFLLGAGFLLLVAVDRPSSGMALASGGALGLAALTRPSAIALAPLLAVPLLDRRHPGRVRRALAGAALVGFLGALAPWTIRNAAVHRAFLPVDDAAGFVILQGNGPNAWSYYRLPDAAGYRAWLDGIWEETRTGFRAIPGANDRNPARRSAAFRAEALRWIRSHPRQELWLLGKKTQEWLRPWPSAFVWGKAVRTLVGAEYLILYALAAVGLVRAERRRVALFCAGILAISMATHVALQVVWRYRMPYWDPVLILYASSAAALPFRKAA